MNEELIRIIMPRLSGAFILFSGILFIAMMAIFPIFGEISKKWVILAIGWGVLAFACLFIGCALPQGDEAVYLYNLLTNH